MSGQILGDRYEVERQLGKKSGRWTLLARDLVNGTPVILKVLFMDENLEQDDLRLFKREVETLQALNHPATPRYLGYFEMAMPRGGKAMVLIQSFLAGRSLEHYLQEKQTLSEAETRQIGKLVLEILSYLHERQPPIIHRDIKPSNILILASPEQSVTAARLVDFGSVKSLAPSEGITFTLVGTEGFMPPEQMGRRPVRASDLFSLGITLVTAMTGALPQDLPHRGLRLDLAQIPCLSPAFREWLQRMVEPDLAQRFTSAKEALQALADSGRSSLRQC